MDPDAQLVPPGDVWAPYRTEIQQLYESKTLQSVKAYMEEVYQFPSYSLSTWKKNIRAWGFDTKHNKGSTMVAAAAHFQQCSDADKRIPFTLPSGHLISERELQRYLRRSKQIFSNGTLAPKATWSSEPLAPAPNSSAIARRDSRLHEVAQNTRPMAERLARRRRLDLRRLQTAFLFGQGFVRPADLMAPTVVQHSETFLGALERCLRCSCEVGLWSVNENGYYLHNPLLQNAEYFVEFQFLFLEAGKLHEHRDFHRARKLLLQALSALQNGLTICLPNAVTSLLDSLLRIRDQRPEYVRIAIKWCSALVGGANDTYPGLKSLFSAIEGIELDALPHSLTQAWDVLSRCFEALDDRLSYSATQGKIRKILNDRSVTREYTADALASLLQELKNNSKASIRGIVGCTISLAWAYSQDHQFQKAKDTVEGGLQIVNLYQQCDLHYAKMNLIDIRAQVHWATGDGQSAIKDLETCMEMEVRKNDSARMTYARILASWQQEIANVEAATAYSRKYDEMIDKIATLSFENACSDKIGDIPESFEMEAEEESSSVFSCEENSGTDAVTGIGDAWQKYVEGKPFYGIEAKKDRWEWREGLESAGQECLAVAVSDHDDYSMMV